MKRFISTLGVTAALGFSGAHAAETVLDFDGTHGGDILAEDLAFVSKIIVDNGGDGPDKLVYFDTEVGLDNSLPLDDQDPDLFAPFKDVDTGDKVRPGGIAIIPDQLAPLADDEGKGGTVTFVFDIPVTMESIRFFDTSKATVKLFSDTALTQEIGEEKIKGLDDQNGVNQTGVLDLSSFAPVYAITIDMTGTSGGFDNITFEAVPIPGALPLMIGGVAALTAMGRRRRKS